MYSLAAPRFTLGLISQTQSCCRPPELNFPVVLACSSAMTLPGAMGKIDLRRGARMTVNTAYTTGTALTSSYTSAISSSLFLLPAGLTAPTGTEFRYDH